MPTVGIRQRVVNPGRRKTSGSNFYQRMLAAKRAKAARRSGSRSRTKNVGEILTVSLGSIAGNPGKKKKGYSSMARKRRKARVSNKRRVTRSVARRRNPARRKYVARRRRVYRRRRNPVVKIYNRRRRNGYTRSLGRKRRTFKRRRNPGMLGGLLSGTPGLVIGILGGAAVTKFIVDKIPANFKSGWMGYAVTAVTAYAQGKVVGKVAKNPQLGKNMMIGGFTLLGLQVLSEFMPGVMGYLPFGLKGMGLLAPSSFYVPQVNAPGSMSNFVLPAAAATAMVPANAGMRGLGMIGRRTARMGRVA